jgi:glycosyltransferase involved in cell wall biosynthesis
LVIDDGVIDPVRESVLLRYPIVQIVPNRGRGLVAALNTGLMCAKFDLIARVDGDDLMFPDRLEIQEDFLRRNQDVHLLGSQVTYIDEVGTQKGSSEYVTGDITAATREGERCLLAHPAVMFRREAALNVGGYRDIFKVNGTDLAEDFDLWIRISRNGKVVNLAQGLTYYRQHSNQLSVQHRTPQEMASYYIAAVARFERDPNVQAREVVIGQGAGFNYASLSFITEQIGIRRGIMYFIEYLFFKGLLGVNAKRLLIRVFKL